MSDNTQDFDFTDFLGANESTFDLNWYPPIGEDLAMPTLPPINDSEPFDANLFETTPVGQEWAPSDFLVPRLTDAGCDIGQS